MPLLNFAQEFIDYIFIDFVSFLTRWLLTLGYFFLLIIIPYAFFLDPIEPARPIHPSMEDPMIGIIFGLLPLTCLLIMFSFDYFDSLFKAFIVVTNKKIIFKNFFTFFKYKILNFKEIRDIRPCGSIISKYGSFPIEGIVIEKIFGFPLVMIKPNGNPKELVKQLIKVVKPENNTAETKAQDEKEWLIRKLLEIFYILAGLLIITVFTFIAIEHI